MPSGAAAMLNERHGADSFGDIRRSFSAIFYSSLFASVVLSSVSYGKGRTPSAVTNHAVRNQQLKWN
jgi:hypothetical protein